MSIIGEVVCRALVEGTRPARGGGGGGGGKLSVTDMFPELEALESGRRPSRSRTSTIASTETLNPARVRPR